MNISLDDAYSIKTPDDSRKLYAKWAASYEADFVANQGYEHPKVIAAHFNQIVPEVRTVIDVGTGTGLVGLELSKLRPNLEIDGVDISPEMLEEAKKKGVYRNLYERDLTTVITDLESPYDSLICIGVFTHGHLLPSAINYLIPLVRSGGNFVIGINANYFKEEDFESLLTQLYGSARISQPNFEEVRVYALNSPHHESLNVITTFQRQ